MQWCIAVNSNVEMLIIECKTRSMQRIFFKLFVHVRTFYSLILHAIIYKCWRYIYLQCLSKLQYSLSEMRTCIWCQHFFISTDDDKLKITEFSKYDFMKLCLPTNNLFLYNTQLFYCSFLLSCFIIFSIFTLFCIIAIFLCSFREKWWWQQ